MDSAQLSLADKIKFLGNTDKDIFNALAGHHDAATTGQRVDRAHAAAGLAHTRLVAMVKKNLPTVADSLPELPITMPESESTVAGARKLAPKVLQFVARAAATEQHLF